MRRLLRIAALAAVAGALALPAGASAERWVTYTVTVEGEGVYAYDRTGDSIVHHDAHWTWQTVLPVLTFQGDKPLTDSPDNANATSTGTLLSAHSTRIAGGDTYECTPVGIAWTNPGSFLEDPGIPSPEPQVGMRLLGGAGFDFDWCPDWAATGFDVNGVLVEGLHTYDTWFTVPREAIGMGRIIQLVHEEVTGRRCPGNLDDGADCTLTFDATITLDKTNDFELPDGPPEDLTPDDIPTPNPTPTPIEADGVVVRAAGAGLPGSARRAAVTVNCPGDCEGTVTATLPRRSGASAARSRVVGRARFSARAGQTRRVVVRFSRSARRRIVRAGGVTLRVRTVTAGRTDTQRLALRLGSSKPKGGDGPRPLSSGRG